MCVEGIPSAERRAARAGAAAGLLQNMSACMHAIFFVSSIFSFEGHLFNGREMRHTWLNMIVHMSLVSSLHFSSKALDCEDLERFVVHAYRWRTAAGAELPVSRISNLQQTLRCVLLAAGGQRDGSLL